MRTNKLYAAVLAAVAVSACALPNKSHAQTVANIGTLTCNVEGGASYIVGSRHNMACTYVGVGNEHERYTGSVSRVGIDIGYTAGSTMVWSVLAASPSGKHPLQGLYVGGSANASVGLGGGANVLISASTESLMLQPVSVQGQVGLNAAVGLSELRLARADVAAAAAAPETPSPAPRTPRPK